jgi:hypothetical protein
MTKQSGIANPLTIPLLKRINRSDIHLCDPISTVIPT